MAESRRWVTRRRLIVTAVTLLALAVGWWFSAYPRGMIGAWADHASGHYEIKTYGYPAPWAWEYRRLVKERYGVEINAEAGCVVTQDLVWYVDGYNSVSRPRIVARHGKDIFAECTTEARLTYEQAHPRESARHAE